MVSNSDLVAPATLEQIAIYDGLQAELRYLLVAQNAIHFSFLAGSASQGGDSLA